jgi:hypothetical protein
VRPQVVTKECRQKCKGQDVLQWQEDECYYACVNRQEYQYYEAEQVQAAFSGLIFLRTCAVNSTIESVLLSSIGWQCIIDIKREGGCDCPTAKASDCDCRSADTLLVTAHYVHVSQ